MFAIKSKKSIVIHALLITAVLFNGFPSSLIAAQARQESASLTSPNIQVTEQKASSNPQVVLPDRVIDTENGQTTNIGINPSIAFVENVGQFDPQARFQAQSNDANMYFSEDAIWFTMLEPPAKNSSEDRHNALLEGLIAEQQETRKGVNLKVNLIGSNPHPTFEALNRVATSFSYFAGSDPSNWQSDVPVWGGIRYVDIYPGMDLEITGAVVARLQRVRYGHPITKAGIETAIYDAVAKSCGVPLYRLLGAHRAVPQEPGGEGQRGGEVAAVQHERGIAAPPPIREEALTGFLAGNVLARPPSAFRELLLDLFLDLRQIRIGDRLRELEVVVEAVLDRRADRDLDTRIEAADGLGQQVRRAVAEHGERVRVLGVARRQDLDPLPVRQRQPQVADGPVRAQEDGLLGQLGADRARRVEPTSRVQ